jgi:hypothetical protein
MATWLLNNREAVAPLRGDAGTRTIAAPAPIPGPPAISEAPAAATPAPTIPPAASASPGTPTPPAGKPLDLPAPPTVAPPNEGAGH